VISAAVGAMASAIVAGLLLRAAASAEAHPAEPCAVTGSLPAPPVPRPRYTIRMQARA